MSKNVKQFDERPWGSFEVLADFAVENHFGPDAVIKKITVKPGKRLSYQSHSGRHEYWLVVSGSGIVIIEGKEHVVSAGFRIQIPKQAKHRMINDDSEKELVFVEISLGDFDENDIVRIEDDFGRS